ncbi:tyrosine-protein kinase receptor Tie-2-like [Anneissia japonica]|uniref:tyrosine-protein kinase receptor Tie-2-like n=1 Tax=Anneissia japonica TaxID=1529436 RepID=UPI001425B27C|nr:tyrosine-protein kinase receptor Tie-2-like [Anneissia japonica]
MPMCSFDCEMLFIIIGLQLMIFNRLSFGSQSYVTLLNHQPSNAEDGKGFQCYTPPIVSGDMLSYGRSYQIDSTDSLTDIPWNVLVGQTRYPTPDPAVAGGNVGVYYCKFVNGLITTIVQTTKRDSDAIIIPSNDKASVSANVGDNVKISFQVIGDVNRPLVWRKDNVEIVTEDTESLTFNPVNVNDAGVYEMHGTGQRNYRTHSFIMLTVRACPRHKWGPPDCTGDCEYCYNGGVCDDKTGLCICAPGFKGRLCEIECGQNKFGWNCEQICTKHNRADACKSYQFCLPDPYGCSCVTGFTGINCLTACSAGTFGAGCSQVCHCNSGTCNRYTGRCTGSDTTCQERWTGSNCQECAKNFFGENCEQSACTHPCTLCSRTGACVEGTCHPNWLGKTCEIGISDTAFTPANYGHMTDIYCIVSTSDSSASIDILLQVTIGDHTENTTWAYSEEDGGKKTYIFNVLAVFGTKYTCIIQRKGEYAEKEITSVIFRPPSYNGNLQAVVLSGSVVEVSWTEWNNVTNTGDGPIIGYILYYRKTNDDEDDDNWEQTSIVNGLTTIVEGLHWETNYTFAVSAVRDGDGGQGAIGKQRAVAEMLCGEPDSVQNVNWEVAQCGTDSTNIIKVTWLETHHQQSVLKCSDLTYYYTVYVKIENEEDTEYVKLYQGPKAVFLFEDYGTDYVIAVTISNKDSESNFVERTIHSTSDANLAEQAHTWL